jgi:heterodisulfide reductase subunit C
MIKADGSFARQLSKRGSFNAWECFNCGTCTALCPVGLDILPRELFRFALLGSRQRLVEMSDTIYSCLLCRMCEENCPQGVKISSNIRTLRSWMAEEEYKIA